MRTKSLIMALAGPVLLVGTAVPAHATGAPSPSPVASSLSGTKAPHAVVIKDPALTRRCLDAARNGRTESAECAAALEELKRLGEQRPTPAVVANPDFTG